MKNYRSVINAMLGLHVRVYDIPFTSDHLVCKCGWHTQKGLGDRVKVNDHLADVLEAALKDANLVA